MITKQEAQKVKEIFDQYFHAAFTFTDITMYVLDDYTCDNPFRIMSAYIYMTRVFKEYLPFDYRDPVELSKHFDPVDFLHNIAVEFIQPISLAIINNSRAGYVEPIFMYDEQKPKYNEAGYFDSENLYILFRLDSAGRYIKGSMHDVDSINVRYATIIKPILKLNDSLKLLFRDRLEDNTEKADKALKIIRKINTMKLEKHPDLVDVLAEAIDDYENKGDK